MQKCSSLVHGAKIYFLSNQLHSFMANLRPLKHVLQQMSTLLVEVVFLNMIDPDTICTALPLHAEVQILGTMLGEFEYFRLHTFTLQDTRLRSLLRDVSAPTVGFNINVGNDCYDCFIRPCNALLPFEALANLRAHTFIGAEVTHRLKTSSLSQHVICGATSFYLTAKPEGPASHHLSSLSKALMRENECLLIMSPLNPSFLTSSMQPNRTRFPYVLLPCSTGGLFTMQGLLTHDQILAPPNNEDLTEGSSASFDLSVIPSMMLYNPLNFKCGDMKRMQQSMDMDQNNSIKSSNQLHQRRTTSHNTSHYSNALHSNSLNSSRPSGETVARKGQQKRSAKSKAKGRGSSSEVRGSDLGGGGNRLEGGGCNSLDSGNELTSFDSSLQMDTSPTSFSSVNTATSLTSLHSRDDLSDEIVNIDGLSDIEALDESSEGATSLTSMTHHQSEGEWTTAQRVSRNRGDGVDTAMWGVSGASGMSGLSGVPTESSGAVTSGGRKPTASLKQLLFKRRVK
eukprot:GHVN01082211.1.p1 GENE.GHVN01082211.1~~GHVN01082211.1.p1  ORF type:complete len:511 (+),score=99.22 GHVN01082211.1:519-2051(+)